MPKKVLIICADMIPEYGMPTTGGGLRPWSIQQGLLARGFDVVCSLPGQNVTYLMTKCWDRLPDDVRRVAWTWTTQEQVIDAVNPDVVVFSSHPGIVALSAKCRVPTVLDMHGPSMLENYYVSGNLDDVDCARHCHQLTRGDLFLTPGHKQKRFFWSWLYRSGFALADGLLEVMPVSLSPQMPEVSRPAPAEPTFVFGGGFFPWTDPSRGLIALVEALERQRRGRLWAFTDNHKLKLTEGRFQEVSRRLLNSDRVVFPGLLPRDELLASYARADVAFDLMSWNPERELAVTTRTVEYLWCGLPVIYNNYAELSPYIKRYNAGWCLDPDDPQALRQTIDDILAHPERLPEMAGNAQRLVRDHFTWDRTIEPLARFCANPQRREPTVPVADSRWLVGGGSPTWRRRLRNVIPYLRSHGLRQTVRYAGSLLWRSVHHRGNGD